MSNIVRVQINDNRTWHPLEIGARIVLALQKYDRIILDFMAEAPAIYHTELPKFFAMLKDNGIDLSRIEILSGNMIEDFDLVKVSKQPGFMFELKLFQQAEQSICKDKQIKYHFGNLVSRCTLPRLVLAGYLRTHYKKETLQTFHWHSDSDYHKTHLGLDDLIHHYGIRSSEFADTVNLLKQAPITRDKITMYPILHPINLFEPCNWYKEFFVDVICETWHQGDNFFVTEKFWRAVVTKTPFIIQGPQHTLSRLKKLGFQTFDQWWDEGYGEDPSYWNLYEIKKVIDYVSKWTIDDLVRVHKEMQPVLENNLEVFKTLTFEDFWKVTTT